MFKTSVLYEATWNSTSDIIVHQGGTSSGKTYSILQVLFSRAISEKCIITVVGQDIPNLKAGALRDAQTIVDSSPELKGKVISYNKTDRVYEFDSGSIMEFKSFQNAQDAKSGKRQYCFINEANGIPHDIYEQLHLRTTKQTLLDYNPDVEFWCHEDVIGKPGTQLIISDHRHNPFVSQKIRDKIEALKEKDYELWKVYARGMTGKIEGLIFRNFDIIDELPKDSTFIALGLDFGFTNDTTATTAIYKQNGELYIDEIIYETNLTNPQISEKLIFNDIKKDTEIVADSAEPKSIQELEDMGWYYIKGAEKGPDSIKNGIDILKRYKLNITRRSVNVRKELRTYKWALDKDGKALNKPVDFNNHAMDSIRYVALNKLSKSSEESWGFSVR